MSDTPTGHAADPNQQILTWPSDIVPSQMLLQLVPNSAVFESPYTGFVQADALPGTSWKLEASFTGLGRDEYTRVRALIARLRGSAGRFYFSAVPGSPAPAAQDILVVTSGPRVAGLSPSGDLLALGVPVVHAGDYVSVDDTRGQRHLLLIVQDALADGSGVTTLVCEPRADAHDLATGTPLHLENASGQFVLVDDEQGQITETVDGFVSVSISAVEYLRPAHFERTA